MDELEKDVFITSSIEGIKTFELKSKKLTTEVEGNYNFWITSNRIIFSHLRDKNIFIRDRYSEYQESLKVESWVKEVVFNEDELLFILARSRVYKVKGSNAAFNKDKPLLSFEEEEDDNPAYSRLESKHQFISEPEDKTFKRNVRSL